MKKENLIMANKNNEYCCMCGNRKDEVEKLIRGKYGYICDSCISIASDIFNDEEEESITNNMQLATPSQIKAHLDQYVIGQDEAKKTIAVTVFYMSCMSSMYKQQTGVGMVEKFCEDNGIGTYTMDRENGLLIDNQSGEIAKMSNKPSFMQIVK